MNLGGEPVSKQSYISVPLSQKTLAAPVTPAGVTLLSCTAYKYRITFLPLNSISSFQVARKLVIIEGDLERTEERAELAES